MTVIWHRWHFHMSTLAAKSQFSFYIENPGAIYVPRMSTQNVSLSHVERIQKHKSDIVLEIITIQIVYVDTGPRQEQQPSERRKKNTSNFPLCLPAILLEPNWKCIHNIYMAAFHPKSTAFDTHPYEDWISIQI